MLEMVAALVCSTEAVQRLSQGCKAVKRTGSDLGLIPAFQHFTRKH